MDIKLSFPKHITENEHILNDLFVTIENVISGTTLITKKECDGLISYQIIPLPNQPNVLIVYEKSAAESKNRSMSCSKLDHKTEITVNENIWYLSPNAETKLKVLFSDENDVAKSCNVNPFDNKKINSKRIRETMNNKMSFPTNITENEHILNNLFVTIENFISGTTSITKKVCDGLIKYQINPLPNQPKVLILYENSSVERNQVRSTSCSKLDHKTEISDYENVWHLSPNAEMKLKQLVSYENDLAKSCNVNAFDISDLLTIDVLEANRIHEKDEFVPADSSILLEYHQENGDFLGMTDEVDINNKEGYDAILRKIEEIKSININFSKNRIIKRQHISLETSEDKKERSCNNIPYKYCSYSYEENNKNLRIELKEIGSKMQCANNANISKNMYHEIMHTVEKAFKCNYCDKTFSRNTHKQNHERTHTGEKPFKCNYCEKRFAQESTKKYHERTHTGEKPFKCNYCDKTFVTKAPKQIHERTHTGEKPYKCNYCDKTFAQETTKKFHERTHTGEKPFKCNYCDKTFSQKVFQQGHERTHTGEKPFKCNYCDKTFSQKVFQQGHERTHTGEKPFKCNYCDKTFSRKTLQQSHERTHTGEKPFNCNYCDKTFSRKTLQQSHERTHTGEKPFNCNYCDKTFSRITHKQRHERTHTGENLSCVAVAIRHLHV